MARAGWDERWQKRLFGAPHDLVSSHDANIMANDTSVGHSQYEQTQVPTTQLVPSMCAIVLCRHDFGGSA